MATRNVVLTDHQDDLIDQLVTSGRYQNASEVLREGLRLVESRESEERARIKALRDAARQGIVDIEEGRFQRFEAHQELAHYLAKLTDETLGTRPGNRRPK